MKKLLFLLFLTTCSFFVSGCETAHGWKANPNEPDVSNFKLYFQDLDVYNGYSDKYLLLPKGEVVAPRKLFRGDVKKLSFYSNGGVVPIDVKVVNKEGVVESESTGYYYINPYWHSYARWEFYPPVR